MRRFLEHPVFLLLVTGTLIGLNFPLGKIAGEAGLTPILWPLVISSGAALSLLPVLVARRRLTLPGITLGRYAVISGLISFVAANLLVFAVIPHVGSGFTGLMFALSPVFTLAFTVLFGFRAPMWLGLAGIAVGFAGAALVAFTRQSGAVEIAPGWIVAAVAIPVTLAAGNVYRSVAWPEGASPDLLAFWSHAASVAVYCVILWLLYGGLRLEELARVPWAAAMQAIVGGLTFPAFFRLQQHGGPVLLSQIGYVAAAVSMFAATVFLGEVYGVGTWIGAAVIACGIALTILAQRDRRG